MTPSSTRSGFNSFALPLARRRGGSAAALSAVVHAAVALLVLWRGALWFESGVGDGALRSGGKGPDRPAISWVALPAITSLQAETPATQPRVTVPTVIPPRIERVSLASPPRVMLTMLPTLTAPVSTEEVLSTGPTSTSVSGSGPDSAGGRETRRGPGGAATGPGSGGTASDIFAGDIFGPTPLLVPISPAGAPPGDKRTHDVQFWIRADGRVTRIAVNPPIRDSGYRRRFMEVMSNLVFGPVKTRDGRSIDYVYSIVVNP